MLRIHAIQTGTVSIKEQQLQGTGPRPLRLLATLLSKQWTQPLPIYAWVIEHPEGLVVIDTGETARALQQPYFPAWNPYYRLAVQLAVTPEQEIGPQLRQLGLSPGDVRWVVLTHLHTDHTGGMGYFPNAEIILSRREYDAAAGLAGQLGGALPQHWPAWFAPKLIQFADQPFGPFPQSYQLSTSGDLIIVPTPGHSPGHLSLVARETEQTIFFAGDTSYTEKLMLAGATDGVSADGAAARQSLARIRQLASTTPLVYLPSHDPQSAQRLNHRQVVRL
jgi:N-acyl homoserine lactone hydrolase